MAALPDGFHSTYIVNGDVSLHVVHNCRENDQRPAIVFLHGFPEFWIAWREVFIHLSNDYQIIAPDQRGFNLSSAPKEPAAYKTKNMVSDLFAVATSLIGDKSFVLAGHDWGASVAYAAAIGKPDKISKLIIANGVHPVCFQEAMIDDPKQRAASQYFHKLTAVDAPRRMAENDYARTFSMFEKFSTSPWVSPEIRKEYLQAWSQPGRLEGMLNWYRSSPIVVPKPDENIDPPPLYGGDLARFSVPMDHLLIWGHQDQALIPSSIARLPEFAPKLTKIDLLDADHWLLHTHSQEVADRVAEFLRTD